MSTTTRCASMMKGDHTFSLISTATYAMSSTHRARAPRGARPKKKEIFERPTIAEDGTLIMPGEEGTLPPELLGDDIAGLEEEPSANELKELQEGELLDDGPTQMAPPNQPNPTEAPPEATPSVTEPAAPTENLDAPAEPAAPAENLDAPA